MAMVNKCWRSLALVVFLVSAIALAGCRAKPEAEAEPTAIPTAVVPSKPTYTVQKGPIADEVTFSGRVAPVQEEQLFFKVDGRVATVKVEQGAKVKKGDILAELEISDLQNQMAQANLNLQQAQERLKNAKQTSGDSQAQAEINLAVAKLRLEQSKVLDPAPAVAIAAANRDKAKSSVQAAQAAYDSRAQRPGVEGSGEAMALQRATLDLQIAQAQYDQALQNQKSHEIDLQILEYSVRTAEASLAKAGGSVDPALAQEVAKAQLVVDRLQAQVENARLIAPIDGEVTMVGAYAGRTQTAYRAVMTIAAPGALEISADLMSDTMAKLSVGQKCSITMTNFPSKTFHGTIRRLPYPYGTGGSTESGMVEEDRSTRVTLDDADVALEKGALASIKVTLQQKDEVLWLPPGAIRTFSGKDFVLVLSGDGQQRVPVKLGIKSEDKVEILSGVTEGQVVVGP